MALIVVFHSIQPMAAQVVKSRLEAAGFHPEVRQELAAFSNEGYSLGAGGITVEVPESEAQDARELLDADNADPAPPPSAT